MDFKEALRQCGELGREQSIYSAFSNHCYVQQQIIYQISFDCSETYLYLFSSILFQILLLSFVQHYRRKVDIFWLITFQDTLLFFRSSSLCTLTLPSFQHPLSPNQSPYPSPPLLLTISLSDSFSNLNYFKSRYIQLVQWTISLNLQPISSVQLYNKLILTLYSSIYSYNLYLSKLHSICLLFPLLYNYSIYSINYILSFYNTPILSFSPTTYNQTKFNYLLAFDELYSNMFSISMFLDIIADKAESRRISNLLSHYIQMLAFQSLG